MLLHKQNWWGYKKISERENKMKFWNTNLFLDFQLPV